MRSSRRGKVQHTIEMSQEPPAHLSDRSRSLWRDLVPRRAKSPERLTLLRVALEALDQADKAREAIEREGLTVTSTATGVVHVHPAAKIEKEARGTFLRAWKELRLDWSEIDARQL